MKSILSGIGLFVLGVIILALSCQGFQIVPLKCIAAAGFAIGCALAAYGAGMGMKCKF